MPHCVFPFLSLFNILNIPKESSCLNILFKGKGEIKAPRERNFKALCWFYRFPKWDQTVGRAGSFVGDVHRMPGQLFSHLLCYYMHNSSTVAASLHLALSLSWRQLSKSLYHPCIKPEEHKSLSPLQSLLAWTKPRAIKQSVNKFSASCTFYTVATSEYYSDLSSLIIGFYWGFLGLAVSHTQRCNLILQTEDYSG